MLRRAGDGKIAAQRPIYSCGAEQGAVFLGVFSMSRVRYPFSVRRRGSQVVRRGSAKAVCVGSIPTLASLPNCAYSKDLRVKGSLVDTKTDTRAQGLGYAGLCRRMSPVGS
jgi:hypothetical protein